MSKFKKTIAATVIAGVGATGTMAGTALERHYPGWSGSSQVEEDKAPVGGVYQYYPHDGTHVIAPIPDKDFMCDPELAAGFAARGVAKEHRLYYIPLKIGRPGSRAAIVLDEPIRDMHCDQYAL